MASSALRSTAVAVLALACLLPASPSASASKAPQAPLVGAVFSRTGPGAPYGPSQVRGAELAADEVNANAGAPGILRLEVRDDGSNPARAKAAFTSLIGKGAVALLGPTLSSAALTADRVAQARKVPVVGVSNTVDGITEIGDHVFRVSLGERVVQPNTVAIAKQRKGLKRAAMVWATPDAYAKSAHGVFRAALKRQGIRLVSDRSFVSGSATSLDRALDAAAKTRPPALVVSALEGDAVAAIVAARKRPALRNALIIGGNALNAPGLYARTKGAVAGAIVGTAWVKERQSPGNAAFVAAYRARYHTAPDQFAAQAYTGVKLLAAAIQQHGTGTVRDALAAMRDVPTILGPFSFDSHREPQYRPSVVQLRRSGPFQFG